MHQPIRWHEWGAESFAAAQRENKPMLLDIGAVWCHWCHVMDRESYDDPEIAAIVNEHFIAVKVDRDERPDIDSRYQAAVQAVSGQGGWPLTAFLTPDGKPFYGGTYFPPSDGYGRPSFRRVLLSIANAYKEKHGDVVEQAKMVESAIAQSESFSGKDGRVSASVISAIQTSAFRMFDPQHGGFGQAPKFPHPSALDLLIERFARSAEGDKSKSPPYRKERERMGHPDSSSPDESLCNMIVTTLEKMANGGVYDQLAGGFHRYSVDERWVVPHFEKMCYDNSELLKNYVHGYQATGNEFFAEVARDIIRWMDEWLSDRERGGFYASQDADISMDDDGDYFTWTLEETRAVLTEEEAQVAALRYDINEVGEMHHNPGKNVLYVRASLEEIGKRMNLSMERVAEVLASAKQKMYAARLQRPTPYVDKTVYVGWNSLCVSACLEAAKVLHLTEARKFALRSLDRVLAESWKAERADAGEARAARSGLLLHVVSYSDPKASHREVPGLLDDYAFTALACLDAYEATADLSYFKFARTITDSMIARFYDATSGGFFDSEPAGDGQSLGVLATRRKPLQDSPTPAGNPMAAIALLRLHHYTGETSYRDKAEETLETFARIAEQFGIFAATYGIAVVHLLESPVQVVVIAEDGDEHKASELYSAAVAAFAGNKTVLRFAANQAVEKNLPPVFGATIPHLPTLGLGRSFAVLCSGSVCQPPVFDPAGLETELTAATKREAA